MFHDLRRLLQAQSNAWTDGCLVFDGGANPRGSQDADAIAAFAMARMHLAPIHGVRQTLTLTKDALRPIAPNAVRPALLELLREEALMFSAARPSNESLNALADAFLAEFDAPVCFSNFTGGAWSSVTPHARDTFVAVVDRARVGYWLTCDDE